MTDLAPENGKKTPAGQIIDAVQDGRNVLLTGGAGCLAPGTKVIDFDGKHISVEKVRVGDKLMGPDGKPRVVTRLYSGQEQMLRVDTIKGDSYTCNRSHVHTFYCSFDKCGLKKGELYDMTYDEFLKLPESAKRSLKTIRGSVDFPERSDLELNPRILGMWLGDGNFDGPVFCFNKMDYAIMEYIEKSVRPNFRVSKYDTPKKLGSITFRVVKTGGKENLFWKELSKCRTDIEKIIPEKYLNSSRRQRLELLAGILDTDGHLAECSTYEICQKGDALSSQIIRLAKSLGFMVTARKRIGKIKKTGFIGKYNRIFISGDFSDLELLVDRKVSQKRMINKNPLVQSFKFTELENGQYFGFELSGPDRRFLLGNFIITHNTGKSYNLRKFIDWADDVGLEVACTAMTGMASLQFPHGETIHRCLGIGIKNNKEDLGWVVSQRKFDRETKHLLRVLDVLIVDEISMMRSDVLELCDAVLKYARENNDPFGGVQVIFSGDFCQLPAVVKSGEKLPEPWAFSSHVWDELNFKTIYLTEIKRQDDKEFCMALNLVRAGVVNPEVSAYFERAANHTFKDGVMPVKLMSTNSEVNRINMMELAKNDNPLIVEKATTFARDEYAMKRLLNDCPAMEKLELKYGAQVMVIVNDPSRRYVNGSMGLFIDISECHVKSGMFSEKVKCAIVELFETGETVSVPIHEWTIERKKSNGDIEIIASMTQFPIKLAWAITTHKSQGMSIDYLQVDLSRCFAPGQAYVALSRARRYSGLKVVNWKPSAVMVDKKAFGFYMGLKEKGEI